MIWKPYITLMSVSTTVIMFTLYAVLCWLITRKAHWHTVRAIGIGCCLVVLRFLLPIEFPGAKIIHIGLKASTPFYWLQDTTFLSFSICEWLGIIWLIGTLIALSLLVSGLCRQAKLVKTVPDSDDPRLHRLVRSCSEILGVSTEGKIVVSDCYASPMMAGFRKPVVFIPKALIQRSDTELCYILLHELAHFKQHDLWFKLGLKFLCCLLWWNPAAYLLRSCVSQLLELRSDSCACRNFSPEEKVEYAEVLLTVVKQYPPPKFLVIAGHFGYSNDKRILQRFEQLLASTEKNSRSASVIIIAVALVSFLFTYSCTIQLNNTPQNPDGSEIMVNQETDFILRYPDGTLELYRGHQLYAELQVSSLTEEPYCDLTVYDVNISDD